MPAPLTIAMTLPGAMVVLPSARIVWMSRHVNVVRLSLLANGVDDEETRLILRAEVLDRLSLLGRIVRLGNLSTCRF